MDARDAQETIAQAAEGRAKRVALLVAILAALLAIIEVGGGNAEQDALKHNIDASNLWSFFQAKTIRQTTLRVAAESLEVEAGGLPPEQAQVVRQRIEAWRATADRYETEPETNEGRKELVARAQAAEKARDVSLAADNMFDLASAALQLGIVLASVAIVTGVMWLAWVAAGCGGIGLIFSLLGWLAPTALPFLG
jgi:hypothetical protein